ncbi:MAG: class I SAM-dependent methyltransferase [Planctomycetota bacterium]
MHDDGYFDRSIAATYDEGEWSDPASVTPIVDRLASLAGGGAALELGVGTGRIALPLAARGVAVHGIDMSRPMLARLRAKQEEEVVRATLGDFSTTAVEGSFSLVYLVFNTIMNLTTQDAQVACFRNAAQHLQPGGRFVIEVIVPRLQKVPFGERHHVFGAEPGYWGIDEYDVVTQGLISSHIRLEEGAHRLISIPFRYAWPAELDLMARLAGLRLQHRWGGWGEQPFTATSDSHVSVWEKPAA